MGTGLDGHGVMIFVGAGFEYTASPTSAKFPNWRGAIPSDEANAYVEAASADLAGALVSAA